MRKILITILSVILFTATVSAQNYDLYVCDSSGKIWGINITDCTADVIINTDVFYDIAIIPGTTDLYGMTSGQDLHHIDLVTGVQTFVCTVGTGLNPGIMNSLVASSSGTLYAASDGIDQMIVSIDPTSCQWSDLGSYNAWGPSGGDMTFYNDEMYLITEYGELLQIDTNNVINSIDIGTVSGGSNILGIVTVPYDCEERMIATGTNDIYIMNTNDLTQYSTLCPNIIPNTIYGAASMYEGFTGSDVLVNLGPDTTMCEPVFLEFDVSFPGADYLWQDNSTASTYTVTSSGTYSVSVTDNNSGNNCVHTDAIVVTSIGCGNTFTYQDTCYGDSTLFSIVHTNPVDSVFWIFDDPGSGSDNYSNILSPTHVFPNAGWFEIKLINYSPLGTTDTISQTLYITENPSVSLGPDIEICSGESFNIDAGTGYDTYTWSNTEITQTISVSTSDSYSVTVTDVNGCLGEDEIAVLVHDLPTVIANANDAELCEGETVTLTGSGAESYVWDNAVLDGLAFTPLVTNTYTVTGTDVNGCENTAQIAITINSIPTLTANADHTEICEGETVTLTGSGAESYVWDNTVLDGSAFTPLTTNTYHVSGTDANGCENTSQITIAVNPLPTVIAHADNTEVCEGETVTLTGSGAETYAWDNGVINAVAFTPSLGSETYFVTGTDHNSCSNTASIIINTDPSPIVSLTPTHLLCYGFTNGAINSSISGGVPPYSILWSNDQTTEYITALGAGDYTLTVCAANHCKTITTATITQPANLVVSLPNDFYMCSDSEESINTSTTGGVSTYTYSWNTTETASSITVSPSQATNYTVTVTDANNCTATNSITIDLYPPLEMSIFANRDSVCPSKAVELSATCSGGKAPYQISLNGNSVSLPIHVYPTDNELYTVSMTDLCQSTIEDSYTLYNYPSPPLSFSADELNGCAPLEIHFTEHNNCEGCSYVWSFDYIGHVNLSLEHHPVHIFEESGIYNVTASVSNPYGCKNTVTVGHMITVFPVPDAAFVADPEIASILKPIIYFDNKSEGAIEYAWSFGDGENSNMVSPQHTYNQIGDYEVGLVAYNAYQCSDTINYTIVIKEEFTFYAPTAFAPNGNGVNDYFKVFGVGIDNNNFHLLVYDRWGEPIFESNDIKVGWSGKAKQGTKVVQAGTYKWLCIFKDHDGMSHEQVGNVTVIR